MIMMIIMLFTERQECAGRDRIHVSAFCASIIVTADVPLSADSGTARGWSFLKTYIFVYIWAVVGWSDFFFFFNLLARRKFPFGGGNYPFLICKLITAALPSLARLIILEPPPASSFNLFLAQSLKPQCETVHLQLFPNCQRPP